MKKVLMATIRLYQRTISPDHGWLSGGKQRVCRFHPTCSEYTYQAIEKYGAIRGLGKGTWRVLRCNPFNKGGNDPLK
jgi:hypothetical protein